MQHFGDSPSDRQVHAFLERLLESIAGKRLDRITPDRGAATRRLTPHSGDPPVSSNGHGDLLNLPVRFAATGTLHELVTFGFLSTPAADFLAACARAGQEHT